MNHLLPEEQGFDENSFVTGSERLKNFYKIENPSQQTLEPSDEPAYVGWNTVKRPFRWKDEEANLKDSKMPKESGVSYLDHPTGRLKVEITHIPKLKSATVWVRRERPFDERVEHAGMTSWTGERKIDKVKLENNKYQEIGAFTYSTKTGHIASVLRPNKNVSFLFNAGVHAAKELGVTLPVDRGEIGKIEQAVRGPHMSLDDIEEVINRPEKLDLEAGQQFNRDIIRAARSPEAKGMPREGWLGHLMPDERTNYIYGPDRWEGLPLSHHHDTMYHVAPRERRESIRLNGLMPNATTQTGSPLARRYGVFLASRTPATGYGDDIYEVRVPQKDLRVDAKYGGGFHYVERPILHHEFKMVFHKGEDNTSHEGNYLSCPECGIHT